jgi:molybdopterin-guanine dinucleotide biosynthesis protein A
MFELLGDAEAAVPRIDGHLHPLAAVYRRAVLPTIEEMLARDQLKLQLLFDLVPTRFATAEDLRPVDPQLHSLRNVNTPDDLRGALAEARQDAP